MNSASKGRTLGKSLTHASTNIVLFLIFLLGNNLHATIICITLEGGGWIMKHAAANVGLTASHKDDFEYGEPSGFMPRCDR